MGKRKAQNYSYGSYSPYAPYGAYPAFPAYPGFAVPAPHGVPPGVPLSGVPHGVPPGVPLVPQFAGPLGSSAVPSSAPSSASAAPNITPEDAFGALATWDPLPDAATVEMVVLVDMTALLPTPGPSPHLFEPRSAKLLESGFWYDRENVLLEAVEQGLWNTRLVDLVELACRVPNSVVVVHTGRPIERTPIVQQVLATKGIKPHMFAHNDYSQAQKTRKHQLVQRLWHFFPQSTFVYYETPVSPRETKEMAAVVQRLAVATRPLPILQEVHNPRLFLSPLTERKILESILDENPTLEASILPDRWVWRLEDYSSVIGALASSGFEKAVCDYIGRTMDHDGDQPVVSERGAKRELRAAKLVVAGSKISLVFDNEHTLPVARLKERATDGTWPVDFAVPMSLEVLRQVSLTQAETAETAEQTEQKAV